MNCTPLQKVLFPLTGCGLFLFLFVIVFADKGLLDLNRLKKQKANAIVETAKIENENKVLFRKIERIKNDPEYIESIAREELGMIGKDEMIYKFKK